MDNEIRLREAIRKKISKVLDEMSTTGAIAGYLTPNAFVGDENDNAKHISKIAKQIGYSITPRGKKDMVKGDKLEEKLSDMKTEVVKLTENYYAYRNDETKQPHQKIGNAISELNKQIKLIERALTMNQRLQKESGISDNQLWKRTANQMVKMEAKLIELAGRLREMRG